MPSAVRLAGFFALAVGLSASVASAQPQPQPDAKELQKKFIAEREQAVKAKFPPQDFLRADDLAKRAEVALKADNTKAAARYFRDARWQLPYLPAGLPEHVVRVLGESRLRHADRVNALAFSPDGTRLASCSKDFTVKVWDLANGREVATYRGHADQPDDPTRAGINVLGVSDVAFHPKDPKRAVSVCGNQVHVWDAETGKGVKTLLNLGKNDKPLKTVAFHPGGTGLVVGGDDGIIRLIDYGSGTVTFTSPTRSARIETLAYSPNGVLVAAGDSNTFAAVYTPGKPNTLAMTAQVVPHGSVYGVAFTADNASIFTCGAEGKVRLYAGPKADGTTAGNTSTLLREFVGHAGTVTGLAVPPGGSVLVTGGEDRTVRVWEASSGKQLRSFQGHIGKVTTVAIRGDAKQVASAAEDGTIRVWDLNSEDDHRAFTEATDSLWAVAFSPDGKRVAAAGADRNIRVYDPETGKLEATLSGAKSPVTSLAFLADSNRLVAGGGDQALVVWDVEKKKPAKELSGHESAVLAVAASDDGKLVVSGAADKTARGFDPDEGKSLWTWSGRSAVCAVAVRKGNRTVTAGLADGSLVVLDVAGKTPRELSSAAAHVAGVSSVAYSPDGTRLASVGGDGALRVWTVADNGTLSPLMKFEGQTRPGAAFSPLTGVCFSKEGRYVAAVGADAVVRVWDVQTKSEVRGLQGHTDWVTAVAFSPDGRYLASVGVEKDRVLRLFELPPLERAGGGGHVKAINAVAVSPDGRLAATAGTDDTIKVWDLGTGKEVATLVGNDDTPFALAFLANDALVMGGSHPKRDAGALHFWATGPNRLARTANTGEIFNAVAAKDGSRVAVWDVRPAVGEKVKNNSYQVFDSKGNPLPDSTIADKGRDVRCATFTPDLAWAVTGDSSGAVRIWDMAKKEVVKGDWPLFTSFLDIGITADKKLLVAADARGEVKIADVDRRETLGTVTPHKSLVRTLVVSPNGSSFLTVGNDGEVKVWSLAAGAVKEPKPTRTWAFPVAVNAAAYTPDGKHVVTANADGTAYVLELPGGDTN